MFGAVALVLIAVLTACGGAAASAPPVTAGSTAPAAVTLPSGFRDFDLVAYQGEDLLGGHNAKFSNLFAQGKPVVLNFWAGLCPPCQAEMPGYQRVYAAQQGKVIFFGLDVGPFVQLGSHDDAVRLYQRLGIRYPLAYAASTEPLRLYSVQGMPTTVFFSAKGDMIGKVTGMLVESQLNQEIQKLLTA